MTGLDRVTEEVVRTGDTSWLEEFFHPYSLKKENYAYCLHVNRGGRRELVRGFLFSDPPPARLGMIDGFSEHLARVRPEGFWDWVFALDTYNYLAPGVFRFRTEKPEPELGPGDIGRHRVDSLGQSRLHRMALPAGAPGRALRCTGRALQSGPSGLQREAAERRGVDEPENHRGRCVAA